MRLSLCLLALGTWMCVDTAAVKTSILQGFNAPELACFAKRQLYYPGDGKCHNIPDHTSICPSGQWLVLDAERQNMTNQYQPVCKKKLCTGNLETYWPANRTCIKITGWKSVCPQGNTLADDKYGEGACMCQKDPPHLPLSLTDATAPCYQLYTKGPCPKGQVLQAVHRKNEGRIAACRNDPCARNSTSSKQYALYSKNNRCYPLNEQHPCPKQSQFKISERTLAPDCVDENVYSIFSLPSRCSHDQAGDCKKEIILAEEDKETEAFNLIMGGRRKRKRSSASPKR